VAAERCSKGGLGIVVRVSERLIDCRSPTGWSTTSRPYAR